MKYELDKLEGTMALESIQLLPWHMRLLFKLLGQSQVQKWEVKDYFFWLSIFSEE